MSLWVLRAVFLLLCMLGGYAISQVQRELIEGGFTGVVIGFGFGGLLIAIDEMVKGFSLRAFSAMTFGLILGTLNAWLVDRSQLFIYADDKQRFLIRLCLFVGFSYLGMILAMRSNKEDFSLIIPYVRFAPQRQPQNLLVLDTSAIIDGRIVNLIGSGFLEGTIVVPRFVLRELQTIADSADPLKRARGQRGLEMLSQIQRNKAQEVKIHEGDITEEKDVDMKLLNLARTLGATLYTTDYNLSKIAEIHSIPRVNIHELAQSLKAVVLPGDQLVLRVVREGKDRGQGVGYLPDGTMVVVNQGFSAIGQEVSVEIQSLLRTSSGLIAFADIRGDARVFGQPQGLGRTGNPSV